MDLTNMLSKQELFFSLLEKSRYSKNSLNYYRKEFEWLCKNNNEGWLNYKDALEERLKSVNFKNKSFIIGFYNRLNSYDLYDIFIPRHNKHKHQLISSQISCYQKLSPEFLHIVNEYKQIITGAKLKESTIEVYVNYVSNFFYSMQCRGVFYLKDCSEEDVKSHFISDRNIRLREHSCAYTISHFCEILKSKYPELKKIQNYIPILKKHRKNIQFLTTNEVELIKKTLRNLNNSLSFRDRAIITIMLYMGIRASDVVKIKFCDINWIKQEMVIKQQKTNNTVVLPFVNSVGNAIIDYLEKERFKDAECDYIFLNSRNNGDPICACAVRTIVNKFFKLAEIRQNKGDRKGCHLFRHNFVVTNTNNNTQRAVISSTLGHISPDSIDAYLNADIEHLRSCAISIENFPVPEEIFNVGL